MKNRGLIKLSSNLEQFARKIACENGTQSRGGTLKRQSRADETVISVGSIIIRPTTELEVIWEETNQQTTQNYTRGTLGMLVE